MPFGIYQIPNAALLWAAVTFRIVPNDISVPLAQLKTWPPDAVSEQSLMAQLLTNPVAGIANRSLTAFVSAPPPAPLPRRVTLLAIVTGEVVRNVLVPRPTIPPTAAAAAYAARTKSVSSATPLPVPPKVSGLKTGAVTVMAAAVPARNPAVA